MSKTMRILGIAASHQSYNQAVARAVTELAPEDTTIEIFKTDDLPLFNEHRDPPTEVLELKRHIREADAILFFTPEYDFTPEYNNSLPTALENSTPGALENAIDWVSRPSGDNSWSGKPAAIMRASTDAIMDVSTDALSTTRAQYHLRQRLLSLNMFPLNEADVMIGAANERFDTLVKLTDEETAEYVSVLIQSLVDWTRHIGKADGIDRGVPQQMRHDEQPGRDFLPHHQLAAAGVGLGLD